VTRPPRLSFPSPVRAGLAGAALLTLAGCADLPSSGPTAGQIQSAQRQSHNFDLVYLDRPAIERLAAQPKAPLGLANLAASGAVDAIGPGDVLQITIFEVGASLFSPRGSAVSNYSGLPSSASEAAAPLPPVTVDRDGKINLPWIGELVAAGRTPDALAADITAGLKGKSQDPQVVVSVHENLANTVVVMGDVKRPGRIPLTLAHERLLDAVALAGGASQSSQDTVVELRRGPSSVTVVLDSIEPGSPDDVALLPNDRVAVTYKPRTFTVFGATGKVTEVPFQNVRVSLAEAVARTGGPSDQQADPTAVFVFRYEPSAPDGAPLENAKPTAYRLNMMEAQSYFLAQRFEIRPRDVIYIANARANQPSKVLQVLNLFFQPFYTAKVVSGR
jgi:polysaccharide export outer membrane protein